MLWGSRPLLLFAGAVFAFQIANGALLPFIAQAVEARGDDLSIATGALTVTAQVNPLRGLPPELAAEVPGRRHQPR